MPRPVKTSKKLTEINQNAQLIPVFQDEVHFQAQTTITRTWAEKGSEPKVMSKPGKDKIAYSGFIIPKTGELVVTNLIGSTMNLSSNLYVISLRPSPVPRRKNTASFWTLDNAPWHKKAIRLIWTEQLEEYADI